MKNINFTDIDLNIKSILKHERVGMISQKATYATIVECDPIISYLSTNTLNNIIDPSVEYEDVYQEACVILIDNMNKLYLTNRYTNLAITAFNFIDSGLAELYGSEERNIFEEVSLYELRNGELFEAYVEDPTYSIDEIIDMILLHDDLERIMHSIPERERSIIKQRFGFETGDVMYLHKIGRSLNKSSEQIRRIEAKALRKLRNPTSIRYIKEYNI